MKKISYIFITIISLFIFSFNVSAKEVAVVNGTDVRLRSSIDTSSSNNIITSFNTGIELELLSKSAGSNASCSKWYQVKYNNQVGYICGEFVTIKEIKEEIINPDDYKEYNEYLKDLGFPDTYIPYLINLHNLHPLWQFKVFKTDLVFNEMLDLEYDGLGTGWSLMEDTGRYFDGYKSTDPWSYNYLTDIFSNNFSGGGDNWYAPSKKTISYYMDPRNFLNERQVFMFETLSYNKDYHTKEGIEAMLKGTFMTGLSDDTHTYADAFMDAATKYNVSPYVLISRVIQEVGASGSTIVSGKVSGYEGYYNFYNINATGAKNLIITNGLSYAKEKDWSTPYKAIIGGASFLADGYINVGQDTLYLQKWDLIVPKPGRHQYMQNIQAPSTESIKTYNGYKNINLIDGAFIFSIPVFVNMPEKTTLPSTASPNNYLSTLSVNGSYLFNKPTTETNFNIVLDESTKSVQIDATKLNNQASIDGTGSISIPNDSESLKITVTAGNGDIRTYTINIAKKINNSNNNNSNNQDNNDNPSDTNQEEPKEILVLDISEILRTLNIKNDGKYIYGYELGTDVSTIIKSITDKESNAKVLYNDKLNKEKNSGIIASGDTINIKTNREEKTYIITIYGDVNGDGLITSADYIAIKNHIMDVKKLNDTETICADPSRDGKVSSADYIAIKNHIMDVKKINQ